MLEVEGLCAGYGDILAVRDVSLTVAPGEIVAIVGRNGVGKTTTVNAIAGLLPIVRGSVHFDGVDVGRLQAFQRARLGIALVPEGRRIFRALSVEDNLVLGTHALDTARRNLRHSLADIYAGFPLLAERKGAAAGSLSGGQQQLLAIAQALIAKPRVLLVDEPTAGLSPGAIGSVFEVLRTLAAGGIGVAIVEERMEHMAGIADRTLTFEHGHIEGELLEGGRVAPAVRSN
jgi:branched-chain amino acid transport system ATP-binding protein